MAHILLESYPSIGDTIVIQQCLHERIGETIVDRDQCTVITHTSRLRVVEAFQLRLGVVDSVTHPSIPEIARSATHVTRWEGGEFGICIRI